MFFDLNINELTRLLTPPLLRQPAILAWLRSLAAPLTRIYTAFSHARSRRLYALAHNGQVVYLQALLNDSFDPDARRIIVADGLHYTPLYVYQPAEDAPLYLGQPTEAGTAPFACPAWLPTLPETADDAGACFIVQLPASLSVSDTHLRTLIDTYRLPSRTNYAIVRG